MGLLLTKVIMYKFEKLKVIAELVLKIGVYNNLYRNYQIISMYIINIIKLWITNYNLNNLI